MNIKHTPAPWFSTCVTNINDVEYIHISSPKSLGTAGICDLPAHRYGDLPPSIVCKEREANARLITSAPELLESLIKAVDIMETEPGCNFYHAHIAKFKAAIAKAEGRE
jgi:hypothetical protein